MLIKHSQYISHKNIMEKINKKNKLCHDMKKFNALHAIAENIFKNAKAFLQRIILKNHGPQFKIKGFNIYPVYGINS